MLGLQTSAKKLEESFNKMGTGLKLMAGGAAAIVGGIEIGKGLLDIANKGREADTSAKHAEAGGPSESRNSEADRRRLQAHHERGSDCDRRRRAARHQRIAFGHWRHGPRRSRRAIRTEGRGASQQQDRQGRTCL
jgi:hypothetical protein